MLGLVYVETRVIRSPRAAGVTPGELGGVSPSSSGDGA